MSFIIFYFKFKNQTQFKTFYVDLYVSMVIFQYIFINTFEDPYTSYFV